MAEELREQVPLMKEMLKSHGCDYRGEKGGYEADDILENHCKTRRSRGT